MQVVVKENGVCRIVEHLGSAHDEAELAALMHLARLRLLAGQQVLDLLAEVVMHPVGSRVTVVRRKGLWSLPHRSGWLIEAIKTAYTRLGLGEVIGVTGLLSRWSPLV